jgi:hypothetical protein
MEFQEIFTSDELQTLKELRLEPASLIYDKTSRFPFMKPKRFVCRPKLTDGLYAFDMPPKLPRGFRENIAKIEKRLLAVNNSRVRKLMESAKKNAEFVERFNKELFFKHSFYKGKRISTPELFEFYGTHPYYLTINLSPDEDKLPFISLYAMTFYACSSEDLFTVDGIFSMQPERHSDNAKKVAGNAVFNLILRNDIEEMRQVLTRMGKALRQLQPPRVNLSDSVMLAKNYTLFVGLSEIGRVYDSVLSNFPADVIMSDDMKKSALAARELMKYAPLAVLCNAIAILGDDEDYRDTSAYKKCAEFY